MRGIPKLTARFGEKDASPFAPLHRRLGIVTHVHRRAVLLDLVAGGRGTKAEWGYGYDPVNRVWSNHHLFRANVTLAGAA